MVEDEAVVPARIAGWPTQVDAMHVGATTVRLVRVAALETHLDRARLLRDDDFEPPYWALVWSGARLLAQWIERDTIGRGLRLLDVGCGLGLVALTAARIGSHVSALDRDPTALEFLARSAALARAKIELLHMDLVDLTGAQTYDVVAAAEVLYDRSRFGAFVEAVDRVLAPDGRLYLADSYRIDTREFYAELERREFVCEREDTVPVDEEGTRVRVRLACYRRETGGLTTRPPCDTRLDGRGGSLRRR